MQPTPGLNPGAAPTAPPITPDATTADLLAKHGAGAPLTQSEYGRLGAWKQKLAKLFGGKAGPVAQPAVPAAPVGHPAPVATVAPPEASVDGLPPVPVDAGVARRVAESIITRGDAACVNWIERHAVKAGAAGERLDRCRVAARLAANDRQLIVDLSPDVFAELGIDPRKSPLVTVSAVFALHALNLWQVVDELKELARERQPRPVAGTDRTTSPPPAPGDTVTDPVKPGAPSKV